MLLLRQNSEEISGKVKRVNFSKFNDRCSNSGQKYWFRCAQKFISDKRHVKGLSIFLKIGDKSLKSKKKYLEMEKVRKEIAESKIWLKVTNSWPNKNRMLASLSKFGPYQTRNGYLFIVACFNCFRPLITFP